VLDDQVQINYILFSDWFLLAWIVEA
jgi:hypothetical protein